LDHSKSYQIALLAGWVEHSIEILLVPSFKANVYMISVGVIMVFGGNLIRNIAMYTASTNFNLTIEQKKRDDHELVIHGIYKFLRHPSYFGWFYWSIGTQIILVIFLLFYHFRSNGFIL
jgi:protein-S-isoprenylcysteine O-methyltransferase